ncbi:MAG: nuclear transport factor 2 family protein [Gemmataceae bacterium]
MGLQALVLSAALMAAADADDLKAELTEAIDKLQVAYNKADVEYIRNNTVKDHVAITTYLQMFDKASQLKDEANLKVKSYKLTGLKVIPLDKDTALASYQAELDGTYKGKKIPARVHVLAVWIKKDGKWLEASYQETPLPAK